MIKYTFLFLILSSTLFVACSNNQSSNAEIAKTVSVKESTSTTQSTPQRDTTGLLIFDTFEEFDYLLHQENDTTYVINFWATWCKPCVAELPYFEELHQKYKNQKVKVILVSLDFKKSLDKHLYPFLKKNQLQSEVVLLADSKTNNWIDKVEPTWDGAIPVSIVYKGKNRKFIGSDVENFTELEDILKSILNQ